MSCTRAFRFLEAQGIEAVEKVPASRKLGRRDAEKLAAAATRILVAKSGRVAEFRNGDPDAVDSMLGPTGNLRAPTIVSGKRLVVGFDEGMYRELFG